MGQNLLIFLNILSMKRYNTYYTILTLVLLILIVLSGIISFLSVKETAALQKELGIPPKRLPNILMNLVTIIAVLALLVLRKKRSHRSKLLAVTEQLHNIVTYSRDAIVYTDFNLNIISWNKGAEQLFRYTTKKAVGENLTTIIDSEITGERKQEVWAALKKNNFWKSIVTLNSPNKKNITALFSISTVKNITNRNEIIGFICICTDMTFQKKAEEKIEQLALMVESSNDAILTFNEKLENMLQNITNLFPVGGA